MRVTVAEASQLLEVCALEEEFLPRERWSQESWRSEFESSDRRVLVAVDQKGDITGAATLQVVAETAELHRVVVAGEYRGQGIARELLHQGSAWAAERGAKRLLLEVRHDNRAALGLYRSLGGAELATRTNYYGPGADALVMELGLVSGGK